MTGSLAADLPGLDLIVDPDVLDSLSHDDAEWAPAGKPIAAIRARTTEEVQHDRRRVRRPRHPGGPARGGHRPVRRRQRRRRLPHPRPVQDEPDPGDRPGQHDRGGPAGRRQRRPEGGGGRARPLVSARPGQRALVDHRRQRRHQRRRPVLPEIRRDPRLRARPAGRRGRPGGRLRYGGAARPPHHQGRGRLRPGQPVRRAPRARSGVVTEVTLRLRPARAGCAPDRGRRVRQRRGRRRGGGRDHPPGPAAGRAGAARPGLPAGGRGVEAPRPVRDAGGAAAGPDRHPGRGRRRRRRPRLAAGLPGRGRSCGPSSRPTSSRRRRCSRRAGWPTRRWNGWARC